MLHQSELEVFILGGRISYYSAKKGMGCDAVLRYEVVLANGEIVPVDEERHSNCSLSSKGDHQISALLLASTLRRSHLRLSGEALSRMPSL